jgi:hypothetical protein
VEPREEAVKRTAVGRVRFARFALLALGLSFASACQSPKTLYMWGHYEDSVYDVCRGTAANDMAKEVQILSKEVDEARVKGYKVAPGVHAHLGYLYYLSGNSGAAVAQFNAEKDQYPESTKFVDGLLRRMKA